MSSPYPHYDDALAVEGPLEPRALSPSPFASSSSFCQMFPGAQQPHLLEVPGKLH